MERATVRLLEPRESEEFYDEAKRVIYPFLPYERWVCWLNGEFNVEFVLEREGSMLGGIVFGVFDFLDSNSVILEVEDVFIKKRFQNQGLGQSLFLESLLLAKDHYFHRHSFRVAGLIIETGEAADFYQKALSSEGYFFWRREFFHTEYDQPVIFFYVAIPTRENMCFARR